MHNPYDTSPPPPPEGCGRRLFPHVIDQRAASKHSRPFASIPITNNAADGYRDVSYSVLANAINRLAQWIVDNFGPPERPYETIMYIASSDLRYQILIIAAVKAGYISFLPSPRNSKDAFDSLVTQTNAQKLLVDDKPLPLVKIIEKSHNLTTFTIPLLEDLLDPQPVPHISFDYTWEELKFRPFVQVHTSGSTGVPKMLTHAHGAYSGIDGFQLIGNNELGLRVAGTRLFTAFPAFHTAGLICSLAYPVWTDATTVLPPPVPLTADVVNEAHLQSGANNTILAPSTVADLAKDPTYLENLSKLKTVQFGGGPLGEATGEIVARKTTLITGYGATEWIALPQTIKDPLDWQWGAVDEEEGGWEFREREPGLYEACVVRKPEKHLSQPVFYNFPDIDEFCSNDLYWKHPTKPGLWKYAYRLDDIIVFSNGEKLNPVTFEGLITSSPDVAGCVVVGQGRFQAALLIEPVNPDKSKAELIEKIWPLVERANAPTVKHGRISKDHVFFTTPGKSLPRAGKGTIQRAPANKLYAEEIDLLYASLNRTVNDHGLVLDTLEHTRDSISRYLCRQLDIASLGNDEDLFAYGMDSLQLLNLVRSINKLRETPIAARTVYNNATVNKLALALHSSSNGNGGMTNERGLVDDENDVELQESWIAMDRAYEDIIAKLKAHHLDSGSGLAQRRGESVH